VKRTPFPLLRNTRRQKARRFSFVERKPGKKTLFLTRKPEGKNLARLSVFFCKGNVGVLVVLMLVVGGNDVNSNVSSS
jgi:hypothetical protein